MAEPPGAEVALAAKFVSHWHRHMAVAAPYQHSTAQSAESVATLFSTIKFVTNGTVSIPRHPIARGPCDTMLVRPRADRRFVPLLIHLACPIQEATTPLERLAKHRLYEPRVMSHVAEFHALSWRQIHCVQHPGGTHWSPKSVIDAVTCDPQRGEIFVAYKPPEPCIDVIDIRGHHVRTLDRAPLHELRCVHLEWVPPNGLLASVATPGKLGLWCMILSSTDGSLVNYVNSTDVGFCTSYAMGLSSSQGVFTLKTGTDAAIVKYDVSGTQLARWPLPDPCSYILTCVVNQAENELYTYATLDRKVAVFSTLLRKISVPFPRNSWHTMTFKSFGILRGEPPCVSIGEVCLLHRFCEASSLALTHFVVASAHHVHVSSAFTTCVSGHQQ